MSVGLAPICIVLLRGFLGLFLLLGHREKAMVVIVGKMGVPSYPKYGADNKELASC